MSDLYVTNMSDIKVDITKLKAEASKYHYIRFCGPDINGVARSKTVSSRFAGGFLEDGLGFYSGTLAMGATNIQVEIPEVIRSGFPNGLFRPATDQLTPVTWCSDEHSKVGEILCESYWINGKIQAAGPRYVARRQIDRLNEMGYKFMSAFEMECMLFEKDSLKPLTGGNDFVNTLPFSRHEKMLYDFDKNMKPLGIDIETFQCEYSPGQFEFTFVPKYGIEVGDMMFRFKEAMKEMCDQRGKCVTFMTRPFASAGCSNGSHFNHSIWDKDGRNVLYDPTKADNLSDIARHFLGGICKHAVGLTALCCPTVNCYRRLHAPWAPDKANWGIEDRTKMYRVKNTSEKATYFENRLPSGSCNPYVVLAATLAAGLDGIENKIEAPPPGDYTDMPSVPRTLQEALDGLKKDHVLIEALGGEFVDWFMALKQQTDLLKFGSHDISQSLPEEIESERKEYFEFM